MVKTGVRYSIDENNWYETYQEGIVDTINLQRLKPETSYTAYAFFDDGKDEIQSEKYTFTTASPYMYLTVVNEYAGENTFTLYINGTPNSTDLAYNVEGRWILFDLGLQSQTVTIPEGGVLKLRSTTGFSKDTSNYFEFKASEAFSLAGNIASIFDYTDMEHFSAIPDYGLYGLFYYCSTLVKVDVDWNGVTSIGVHGCGSMFSSCTALEGITDPFATVTTVRDYGCESMFAGCRVLDHEFDLSAITSVGVQAFNTFCLNCALIDSMVAPSISTWDTTIFNNWLKNVAQYGTMHKKDTLSIPTNSDSGVPTGWTVVDDIDYLTLTNDYEGYNTFTLTKTGQPNFTRLSYSLDGVNWVDFDLSQTTNTVAIPAGSSLKFKGKISANSNSNYWNINMSAPCRLSGNLLSIYDFDNMGSLTTVGNYAFHRLFRDNGYLTSANISIGDNCGLTSNNVFTMAFSNCAALESFDFYAPSFTYAGNFCWSSAFMNCTSLARVTGFENITSIGQSAFNSTFWNCTALLSIGNQFSRINYVNGQGFYSTFGRSGLTSIDLSSITSMAGLIQQYQACNGMFFNCENLTDIKAPNISSWDTDNFTGWVSGVAASGTFRKPSALTVPIGVDGCPDGWTVVNY